MPSPPFASPYFTPIDISACFNADRVRLGGGLGPGDYKEPDWTFSTFGPQVFQGISFDLGAPGKDNLIHLGAGQHAGGPVRISMGGAQFTYAVFLHAAENLTPESRSGFTREDLSSDILENAGNSLGSTVSTYRILYDDGSFADTAIVRRFATQQRHIAWGASPFAAVPAFGPRVHAIVGEEAELGHRPGRKWGSAETRHFSGRRNSRENLWLYALGNPEPSKPVSAIELIGGMEDALIYGLCVTNVTEHPLRLRPRRKLLLNLPPAVEPNAIGELSVDQDNPEITIDVGTVISARAALDYPTADWTGNRADVQPARSRDKIVVEYEAHPCARLYLKTGEEWLGTPLADLGSDLGARKSGDLVAVSEVKAETRSVTISIIDADTGLPAPARLHMHGEMGEYLPPKGHQRKVNPYWFEDVYGDFVNGLNQYAYVHGQCEAQLPLGTVYVEINRGYETRTIRSRVEVTPETETLRFELEKVFDWRARGWITADTHVHFLSPQTALLEGRAEGIHVVNLLAAQWGEMFSNVADFDGQTTLGSKDFGGNGEFLVRVGTENRMQVLGHISLLGYRGHMIHPLSAGGADEAAIGDPLSVSMADWAARCREQGGLVVMPHAPNPQAERAADIVLGLVDAMEMMTFNPRDAQISAYGLADWYRYLNIGHQIPLVAGSDKMTAAALLGGIRTYASVGDEPLTYENWMTSIKRGNTFITVGPLVEFTVNGKPPGGLINLPTGGGTIDLNWYVASADVPIELVEVVISGAVVEQVRPEQVLETKGSASVFVAEPGWVALRVRASRTDNANDIGAHTSAVQIRVGEQAPFVETDAVAVLEQIEGTIAYVDTIAPPSDAKRMKAIRLVLENAHRRLHAQMHANGVGHHHSPIHGHDHPHEH